MVAEATDATPPLSPLQTGLRGRCPRCGQGRLFNGFLTVADECEHCGLSFDFADTGDGPAFFVSFAAGFIVVGVALWLELAYQPSFWVHALVSLPLILITCVLPLRPLKGLLIAQQYVEDAREVLGSEVEHQDRATGG